MIPFKIRLLLLVITPLHTITVPTPPHTTTAVFRTASVTKMCTQNMYKNTYCSKFCVFFPLYVFFPHDGPSVVGRVLCCVMERKWKTDRHSEKRANAESMQLSPCCHDINHPYFMQTRKYKTGTMFSLLTPYIMHAFHACQRYLVLEYQDGIERILNVY